MTLQVSMKLHEILGTFRSHKQLAPIPSSPSPAGHNVLVIDDDEDLLEFMHTALTEVGFHVMTAVHGAKGLEKLSHVLDHVHVVVLDYQMPVMDGARTLPYVRRLEPAAKVLGVSAAAPQDLPAEYRDEVDNLLRKPFSRDELIRAVSDLLPVGIRGANHELGLRPTRESVSRPIVPSPGLSHT